MYGNLILIGSKKKLKVVIEYIEEGKCKFDSTLILINKTNKDNMLNKFKLVGSKLKGKEGIKWFVKMKSIKSVYSLRFKERQKLGIVILGLVNEVKEVHNGCRMKKLARK